IDGQDQSVPGGNFMWLRHAQSECLEAVRDHARVYVRGRHDGYQRLADPVLHERSVELVKGERPRIVVVDRLRCRGGHEAELFWHFCEEADVAPAQDGVTVTHSGTVVHLSVRHPKARAQRLHGSEQPLGGWISRRFADKSPTTTMVWRWPLQGDDEVTTVI